MGNSCLLRRGKEACGFLTKVECRRVGGLGATRALPIQRRRQAPPQRAGKREAPLTREFLFLPLTCAYEFADCTFHSGARSPGYFWSGRCSMVLHLIVSYWYLVQPHRAYPLFRQLGRKLGIPYLSTNAGSLRSCIRLIISAEHKG
jgi:hypothetical protein